MLHALSLGLALAALWMLLSGFFDVLLISLGIVSVILSVYIAYRMDVVDHEGHPMHHGATIVLYWPWLIWQIAKSNWDVSKTILGIGEPIHPTVFKTPATQDSELDQVIYANSITLTPGTVTLSAESGNTFEVHALTKSSRADIEEGSMNRRCTTFHNKPGLSEIEHTNQENKDRSHENGGAET